MPKEFSLIDFIDRADEACFYRRSEETSAADLENIMALQGKPGAYAGMFALPAVDAARPFRTFTGELITSNAARKHIIGEETIRILSRIDDAAVRNVVAEAEANMLQRLYETHPESNPGFYCCGTCTCALWRNLAIGRFDRREERLAAGLKGLRDCRDGAGRWGRFPFYYTLLALSEIELTEAREELVYALPAIARISAHRQSDLLFSERRYELRNRILYSIRLKI